MDVHSNWVAKRRLDRAVAGLADVVRVYAYNGVRIRYGDGEKHTGLIKRLLDRVQTDGGGSLTIDGIVLVNTRLLEPLLASLDLRTILVTPIGCETSATTHPALHSHASRNIHDGRERRARTLHIIAGEEDGEGVRDAIS